eukprot:2830709-Amphidinium_carterae.2
MSKRAVVDFCPNSAAQLKVQWLGSTEVWVCSPKELQEAMEKSRERLKACTWQQSFPLKIVMVGPDDINSETMRMLVLERDTKTLESLNIAWYKCVLEPEQAVFVPTGWLMVERSDSPVCIGVRKSFFLKSDAARYKVAVQLHKAAGKKVEKMDLVTKLFG